jgi:hypothetical protein
VSGAGDNNNNRNSFLSSSSPLNFNQSSFFDEFQFQHPHLLPAATTGGGSNPLRTFNNQREGFFFFRLLFLLVLVFQDRSINKLSAAGSAAAPSFWPKKLH